jgi:uncharacterized protein (TIGR02145 family)
MRTYFKGVMFILACVFGFFSCDNENGLHVSTDKANSQNRKSRPIDVQDPQEVVITNNNGTFTWKVKNLNVSRFRNGDLIPQVTDPVQWKNLTTPAWCYLNNDPLNGPKYGKLYNNFAVTDPRGLAPAGWHIASSTDLYVSTGGGAVWAPAFMGTTGWAYSTNITPTNLFGTNIIPAGKRNSNLDGAFFFSNTSASFWESGSSTSYWGFNHSSSSIDVGGNTYKTIGMPVRCVKDY